MWWTRRIERLKNSLQVLIVDEDVERATPLSTGLAAAGLGVRIAAGDAPARAVLDEANPEAAVDVVVCAADASDGAVELCRWIREPERNQATPVACLPPITDTPE